MPTFRNNNIKLCNVRKIPYEIYRTKTEENNMCSMYNQKEVDWILKNKLDVNSKTKIRFSDEKMYNGLKPFNLEVHHIFHNPDNDDKLTIIFKKDKIRVMFAVETLMEKDFKIVEGEE